MIRSRRIFFSVVISEIIREEVKKLFLKIREENHNTGGFYL